jgi:hypothetical protein
LVQVRAKELPPSENFLFFCHYRPTTLFQNDRR